MKSKLPLINFISLIAVLIVNGLANALPINGLNTGELSDMYPNLFVPAGFTFSIWGLIYFLLIIWSIYFLLPKQQSLARYSSHGVGYWFLISCIANVAWIFAWHYQLVEASLVIMLVILLSLINAYKSINVANSKWIEIVPFSIYLGWISVATIANTTAVLVHNDITGGENAAIISCIMIIVAFFLALFFVHKRADVFYALVIMWASFGIYSNQLDFPIGRTTMIVLGCLGMVIVYRLLKSGPYNWPIIKE